MEPTDLPNVLTVPPDRYRVSVTFEHGEGRSSTVDVVINDSVASIEEVLAVLRALMPNRTASAVYRDVPKLRTAAPAG